MKIKQKLFYLSCSFIFIVTVIQSFSIIKYDNEIHNLASIKLAFADPENDCPGTAPSAYYTCENGTWRLMQKSVEVYCGDNCSRWTCDKPCTKKRIECQNDVQGETGCEDVPHSGNHIDIYGHTWD